MQLIIAAEREEVRKNGLLVRWVLAVVALSLATYSGYWSDTS